MDKQTSFNIWYVMIAVLVVLTLQGIWQGMREVEQIPYSTFREYLETGRINNLTITETRITGELTQPVDGATRFATARVEPEFAQELERYGVEFRGATDQTFFTTVLSWTIPILLLVGIWLFLLRRMAQGGFGGGGLMSIGKSKAKIYVERDTKTTLDDVAGVDEAKAEVREVIDFLKNPKEYGVLGARMPKGILLVGPPGTGKTLLARAIAGEAGVTFLSISGSEFVEMFVGVGAARVRDLFEQARAKAPCIIFIDELDALGRARGLGGAAGGGHDEKEQTLNQLLVELDGFDPAQGIVLLGATNRPEILDPALLRPGRFDRQILVDRPDKTGRKQILDVHAKKIKLAPGIDLMQVAEMTPGFTGADLANLVNEAALLATRRRAPAVTMDDFTAAIERLIAGLEKRNRLLNPKERRVVAHHELGHALVALSLPGVDPVHKISIIPRGIGALGYTLQRPTEDRFLMTREELENKMAVLLGGRAAEELVFGEISTGAADDLRRVADIARAVVARYGMDEKVGQVAYETEQGTYLGTPSPTGPRSYSEDTAREIDLAVRRHIDAAYEKAKTILRQRRGELETLAHKLLEQETLTAEELPAPTPPPERQAA